MNHKKGLGAYFISKTAGIISSISLSTPAIIGKIKSIRNIRRREESVLVCVWQLNVYSNCCGLWRIDAMSLTGRGVRRRTRRRGSLLHLQVQRQRQRQEVRQKKLRRILMAASAKRETANGVTWGWLQETGTEGPMVPPQKKKTKKCLFQKKQFNKNKQNWWTTTTKTTSSCQGLYEWLRRRNWWWRN